MQYFVALFQIFPVLFIYTAFVSFVFKLLFVNPDVFPVCAIWY